MSNNFAFHSIELNCFQLVVYMGMFSVRTWEKNELQQNGIVNWHCVYYSKQSTWQWQRRRWWCVLFVAFLLGIHLNIVQQQSTIIIITEIVRDKKKRILNTCVVEHTGSINTTLNPNKDGISSNLKKLKWLQTDKFFEFVENFTWKRLH